MLISIIIAFVSLIISIIVSISSQKITLDWRYKDLLNLEHMCISWSLYHFPSNEESVLARLTVYPHANVKFIEKEAIQRIVKESNLFIHGDVLNINRIAETNARNVKDFEIEDETNI